MGERKASLPERKTTPSNQNETAMPSLAALERDCQGSNLTAMERPQPSYLTSLSLSDLMGIMTSHKIIES